MATDVGPGTVALVMAVALCLTAVAVTLYRRLIIRPLQLRDFYAKQGIRGARFLPLVGNLPDISATFKRSDEYFHLAWQEARAEFGPVSWMFLGPVFRLRAFDADLVRTVLVTHADAFVKPQLMTRILGPLLGNGLVLSEGAVWRRHRTMINPAFHHHRLRGMLHFMQQSAAEAMDRWFTKVSSAAPPSPGPRGSGQGVVLDMNVELSAVTLSIIGHAAFGADIGRDASKAMYENLHSMLDTAMANLFSLAAFLPGSSWLYLPTPANLRMRRQVAELRGMLSSIIAARRVTRATRRAAASAPGAPACAATAAHDGGDLLLDYLLDAREEEGSGHGFTDQEVMDEAMTFVLAGHETTSQALTWCVLLLSRHPEWKAAARQQVLSVVGRDRVPSYDDLAAMPLLQQILLETMRLYPPVPVVVRVSTAEVKTDKLTIAPDTVVVVPIAGLHRDERLWDRPHEFDPTRWAGGIAAACRHPMAFLPFAHGPRNCIGSQFALLEARAVLAALLQRCDWAVQEEEYVHKPTVFITLRPGGGGNGKAAMPCRVWPLPPDPVSGASGAAVEGGSVL